MSQQKEDRMALMRLADELVEDILNASDEEILVEFRESYGDQNDFVNRMRAHSEVAITNSNKGRLASVRRALDAEKNSPDKAFSTDISIDAARRALKKLYENPSAVTAMPITIAARKEKISEMSDDEIWGLVGDLNLLGFVLRKRSEKNNE